MGLIKDAFDAEGVLELNGAIAACDLAGTIKLFDTSMPEWYNQTTHDLFQRNAPRAFLLNFFASVSQRSYLRWKDRREILDAVSTILIRNENLAKEPYKQTIELANKFTNECYPEIEALLLIRLFLTELQPNIEKLAKLKATQGQQK